MQPKDMAHFRERHPQTRVADPVEIGLFGRIRIINKQKIPI